MRPSSWTSEQDQILLRLWTEGKSATAISVIMETKSRNAVIGRLHRLRAAGVTVPEHVQPAARPRKPRIRDRIIKLMPFMPPKPMPPVVDSLEGSVTLPEMTGCKWPVTKESPHRFCNKERFQDSAYCAGHAMRATRQLEMKRGKYEVPFQ